MGWGNCGEDSKGRPIGYAHEATCDEPGCTKEIDRGLSYACGEMHGDLGGWACEGYFCGDHLIGVDIHEEAASEFPGRKWVFVCASCAKQFPEAEAQP